MSVIEFGGTSTSADCTYVGHALAVDQMMLQVARSIVRRLMAQLRQNPRSWDEQLVPLSGVASNAMRITLSYVTSGNSEILLVNSNFLRMQSMNDVAIWLNSQFYHSTEEKQFKSIRLDPFDSAPALVHFPEAYINLQDLYVHMSANSSMVIQNRTEGAVAGDSSTTDITANPLEGKAYCGSGNGVKMVFQDNTLGAGTTANFYGSTKNGVIVVNPASTNVTANMKNIIRRPPLSNAFVGVKKMSKVRLQPGTIKRSFWTWDRKMRFPAYLSMLQNRLLQLEADTNVTVSFGKFEFFRFRETMPYGNWFSGCYCWL